MTLRARDPGRLRIAALLAAALLSLAGCIPVPVPRE
jgi:hypothetical protein